MTKVCPYCASGNVRRMWDGNGDVDWCQACHHAWLVNAETGQPMDRNEADLARAGLAPPQDD
ncbi:MAG: hypothetical protein H7Z12_08490 [Rhodospirillaceae bacterium]|nr:hypothetical protein [Rhodospirillales bacterium]